MTLDPLDKAFVARWHSRIPRPTAPAQPTQSPPAQPAASGEASPQRHGVDAQAATVSVSDPLVVRLLTTARGQWHALADELESARQAGHRVIAITGGERGEGRTTLVTCLQTVLRDRGRDVVVFTPHDLAAADDGVVGGGRLHDKRIVLVDAGVWFPPGPIRRGRLLVASLGCDAAILVRRANRNPAPACATALAAVGVEPLGEVVTFASAHGSPDGAAA